MWQSWYSRSYADGHNSTVVKSSNCCLYSVETLQFAGSELKLEQHLCIQPKTMVVSNALSTSQICNLSKLAPGTPLVGFSRSDSEGFVYSKMHYMIFKSEREFLPWNRSSELPPGTPLVGFSRYDSEGFVYSKIDFETCFQKGFFTVESFGIIPRDTLGWNQQVR